MEQVQNIIKLGCAALSAVLTYLFGGFDAIFKVLLFMIVIDYISGVLGAVYHKNLSSEVGYRGIIKKVGILVIVAVAHLVGQGTGIEEVRSLVIGFYIANEGISIVENWGGMGLPLSQKLLDVLRQLREK